MESSAGQSYILNKSELQTGAAPKCPQKKSYKVDLKNGETYYWCTCGLSNKQPFCDGSHVQMPGYKPLKFTHDGPDG